MGKKSLSRPENHQEQTMTATAGASHEKVILQVLKTVKKGDFTVRLPVEWTGVMGKIADELNDIIELNGMFADEFKRVSHVVGKKGQLSERASVPEAMGAWKVNIEAVNGLIDDLVRPTTEMARVIGAVAKGDLTQSVALEAGGHPLKGEFLDTAKTVNSMVGRLDAFAAEVTRVAREVGTEGKLGGQAMVPGVAGTWKDLTDSVNSMASNLTNQVRNIADVTIAVANGDLSKKITADVRGEILQLKDTINTMVDQLRSFAAEVTRVAREVGTEGKLGGQAVVPGVAGTWKDLTDSVNSMASNLTNQVRNIADVTIAVANGDLSKKITVDVRGEILQLKDTINTMVDQLRSFAAEVTRVAREVGTEGKLGGQAQVRDVSGVWKDLTESVNLMAGNLTAQVRNIADVTTAVANGDLSKKITADVRGEILQLKEAINSMVDQLRGFAAEVTRVAREVGTEGKLGGQAVVPGAAGTWKDLTDSVNSMASNLTNQVRNIAEVTTAVANGDLSKKITADVRGEILQLKDTINTMVDQLRSFAAEVTRVAREVGTDGKLGGQAQVRDVSGVWKDLTDSVNSMASNLTAQVRNIAEVTTAVANGDLSKKITADVRGEILQLKEAINTMVDQLRSFAAEVTRVAREVGTEGKLGGQAQVRDVSGVWKDLTESVNLMAGNLTAQVRNIADVTIAVANGDLSKKITVDVRGEILQLKEAINTMVDQLRSFAAEVTRVAREVGTEGKLGGQATVPGVAGTWKDLTESVNLMAGNLTAQVRNIAEVTTAVANGDLSKKITADVRGEILQLKEAINTMVDQLRSFAAEVTRVAREVGTDGKLGGQAQVRDVSGVWKDLTESVNLMAGNLTAQVRNIADVTIAVANGDLSKKITVDVHGEILQLKEAINTMVDQLRSFAAEVTRVAREVGTEGKLGGQAIVPGVAGTWKDLTDNVNSMARNLTAQVRNIAEVTFAVASGDLSKKITVDVRGEILQLKDTINTMVDQLNAFAAEVTRVAREVGTEGKLGGQAVVPGVAGTWKDLTDNVNSMASNLTNQVRNIADVTIAVANGDLSKKITADVRGEILQLKDTINTMVDQLNAFAAEVTRVAREVGTEGKLGGQAVVPGVAGTWKDLTDSVNAMASNLTVQLRDMSNVATAIANGDLTRQITVDVRGEILQIKDVINRMVAQLSAFASEVTRVAREVGTEGKLGGQATVPGVAGTWKDLTESVNLLAANLTTQVRAIAEVATAVTQGDLTRSIQVQARGEVAELKDNINVMISTLRATTDQNTEQDWLKTNLAKFTRMMQGQRDLTTVGDMLLTELAPLVNAQYGAIYQREAKGEQAVLRMLAGYGGQNSGQSSKDKDMEVGAGLVGQCAKEKRRIVLSDIPPDYIRIRSGLGEAPARSVIVLPVLFEGQTKAVIELASLSEFTPTHTAFLGQLTETIGVVVNTIEATMQTEGLLQQSQNLATELQAQQKELQQTNEELGKKAQQLAEQNAEVERKNREIEQARHALEEKAGELALASKYKSEFLANMSHELRTPLNSILILAQQLAENPDHNLSSKQVEFSKNIHAAGADLLNLISDILDLSKIESGTVTVEPEEVLFMKVREAMERSFRHVAEGRQLPFHIDIDQQLPRSMVTDFKRLQQVLKNLLSNAFKFTSHGHVTFRIRRVTAGWNQDHSVLSTVPTVVAFEVIDTGIGIPIEKQKIVFEAFQQADAGTSRRFGGTGLGLAISRELAMLLGGEIRLVSSPGEGSNFTLYLPASYMGVATDLVAPKSRLQEQAPLLVQQAHHLEDIPDDRETLMPGEPAVLIVEDDPHYARVLLGVVREKGFKGLVTAHGRLALALTRKYKPVAITLDIFLPDMLGWTVLSHLKQDPDTRHIPVQILTVEDERLHGLGHGAFGYMIKPTTTEVLGQSFRRLLDFTRTTQKHLLLVEDNDIERQGLCELLSHPDVEISAVDNGALAWQMLSERRFDCVVLDLRLPDMSGFQLLERMREHPGLQDLPVIVSTGRDLTEEEEIQLRELSQGIVLKGVQSPERLLDEATLFLHLVTAQLPPEKQRMLERVRQSDDALIGKKVLVVDDDIRNIFALTSLLERHGMDVVSCETGREAIQKVEEDEDLDMVLMDIMMPEMDGYETMRQIRQNAKLKLLPILALTAKAMKGDRERCLQAGASDYIAKPVNTEELLALLRIWLFGRKKAMKRT